MGHFRGAPARQAMTATPKRRAASAELHSALVAERLPVHPAKRVSPGEFLDTGDGLGLLRSVQTPLNFMHWLVEFMLEKTGTGEGIRTLDPNLGKGSKPNENP